MDIVTPDLSQIKQPVKPLKRMLKVLDLGNGKRRVEINFSSLDLIHTCLRKAKYALLDGYRSETEADALVFGTAIHKALEHWYCLPEDLRQLTDAESKEASTLSGSTDVGGFVYDTALESIHQFVIHTQPLRWLGDDDKRSIANGIKILKAYFKHYANDGLEVYRDGSGKAMIEYQAEFTVHDDDKLQVVFHGQIDLILKSKLTGQIYIVDHKTTAALGKDFYNRINPNHQYSLYLNAGKNHLGLKDAQFMVNGIQVAKTKCEFARQITDRTEEDFQDSIKALVHASKLILNCIDDGYFPNSSPNPCAAYGGCNFHDVCSAGNESMKKILLENKYPKESA